MSSLIARLRSLWRTLAHRDRVERDLDEEIRGAFESIVSEKVEAGLSPAEARRTAALELGHVESIKEQVREVRSAAFIDGVTQDVRYGVRLMRRQPLFTLTAVLSLGLGIGANSATFSMADAFILRPLPVRDPGAIVAISAGAPTDRRSAYLSYENFRDLRERSQAFDGLIAYRQTAFSFARTTQDAAEMRFGAFVSDDFFNVLGIEPTVGRTFRPDEGMVPGRDPVVVLGYDFWKGVLGADASIIRTSVRINGVDFHVIGVAPAEFSGMEPLIRPAFYVPIMMAGRLNPARANLLDDRGAPWFLIKGRLKPGVSQRAAQAELTTLWNDLVRRYPEANRNRAIAVRSELEARIQSDPFTAFVVAMLAALVGLVLLIACANVANLMLGRARVRAREMGIRLALGVSRMRLFRQLFIESLLLALAGCALGLIIADGGIGFFQTLQSQTDLPIVIATRLDGRVLGFSLLVTLVSAVLFGLAPARQSLRTDLVPALKDGAAADQARRRAIGRNGLVVAQIALSMVLLVSTGMLLDGFQKLLLLNPGFRTDDLIVMSLDTSFARYTPVQTRDFYRQVLDRARALPGVKSVALTSKIPLERGGAIESVIPEGHALPVGQETVTVFTAAVDDHYFQTMQTAIVRGRAFTAQDTSASRLVAVVNEEFAKIYWADQDPIGKRLRLGDRRGPWLEVVGVAETGKYLFIGEAPMPFVYLPFEQQVRSGMAVLAETDGDPAALAAPLRGIVRALDVNQPVYDVRVFSTLYRQRAINVPLRIMQMVGTMGLIGLMLALIGLYGLIAYSVARRTREIGVRMALGAARWDVLRMVLGQGVVLSLAGIIVGGCVSLVVARLLVATLVGLASPNAATYVIVPLTLIGLTLAASYVPARRASRVDPVRALRYE